MLGIGLASSPRRALVALGHLPISARGLAERSLGRVGALLALHALVGWLAQGRLADAAWGLLVGATGAALALGLAGALLSSRGRRRGLIGGTAFIIGVASFLAGPLSVPSRHGGIVAPALPRLAHLAALLPTAWPARVAVELTGASPRITEWLGPMPGPSSLWPWLAGTVLVLVTAPISWQRIVGGIGRLDIPHSSGLPPHWAGAVLAARDRAPRFVEPLQAELARELVLSRHFLEPVAYSGNPDLRWAASRLSTRGRAVLDLLKPLALPPWAT
jgi:hypothetical protein